MIARSFKRRHVVVLLGLIGLGLGSSIACQRPTAGPPAAKDATSSGAASSAEPARVASRRAGPSLNPAAVVELFTSEGCASCPRADQFAESLHTQAQRVGLRIFVLVYHVHYWNELGHVDRFSAPRFTDRQRWYAEGWGTTRVYTPQLVIGGTEDVSGNDRRNAILAVSKQLDQKTKIGIALTVQAQASTCQIHYLVDPARRLDYLTLALVQDQADTEVEAGENAGRFLHHVNVVRDVAWSHVGSGRGTWSIAIPPDMPSGVVIAYVQHARTRRVLGVSQVRL